MSGQEQEELLTTLWDLQGFKVVGVAVEAAPTGREPGRRVQVVRLWNERQTHRCPACGREHRDASFEEAVPRRFRDSSLGEWETFVEITPMRVRCCGGILSWRRFPSRRPAATG